MRKFSRYLAGIDKEQHEIMNMLENWIHINSGSENKAGLKQMEESLKETFSPLGDKAYSFALPNLKRIDHNGHIQEIPLGNALSIVKRPEAKKKVLFAGHMDTVYPKSSPFQKVIKPDLERLVGPGAADMKGGLAILYLGLKAFERSPFAENLGWEVFINPDEEIGSVGSKTLLIERAPKYDFGLLFEPAYSDGAVVSQRKGSANYAIFAKGKAAHAGRDFHLGKSAITALARFIVKAEALQQEFKGLTLNVGNIQGGGPINIVPDLASCRINIRFNSLEDQELIKKKILQLADTESKEEGISIEVILETERPPKQFDKKTEELYLKLKECADNFEYPFFLRPSGGVSDGNILAHFGLANIDTMGAIGGNIHTFDEYIFVDSIAQRAKLLALFLMKEAA